MDPSVAEALRRLAEVPAIVEAARPSALARDALVVVSGFRDARFKVSVPPAAAAPRVGPVSATYVPSAMEPALPSEYAEMRLSVQTRIDAELPKLRDYGIALFDGSAKDVDREADRVLQPKRNMSGFRQVYAAAGGGGGFAQAVDVPGRGLRCLVVGLRPATTLATLVPPVTGHEPTVGTMTAKEWQTLMTWHEVGHCLLGASEMKADVFGMLMGVQSGVSRDAVAGVANARESSDFINPDPMDPHVTAAAVSLIARRYDELRADPRFMALDMGGVANFAKEIADRYEPDARAMREIADVRRMIMAAFMNGAYWVHRDRGMVATDFQGWLKEHEAESPVFARLLDLRDRLKDMSKVPTRFRLDERGFVEAVRSLAQKGDPTAKGMVAALKGPAPYAAQPASIPLKWHFENGKDLAGRYVALDEGMTQAVFSQDATEVAVKGADGTLALHDVKTGTSREVPPNPDLGLRH